MRVFRFGWIPEFLEPDERLTYKTSSPVDLPSEISLLKGLSGYVLYQGNTGTCVAQAAANGARIRRAIMTGQNRVDLVPLPSRRFIYSLSCETHGSKGKDEGTYISSALYVMRALGWPDEKHFPWDEGKVKDEVNQKARQHAFDQRGAVHEYAITQLGSSKERALKSALAEGYPVIFGAHVDDHFCECRSWDPEELKGDSVGGHAMLFVGYDQEGAHILNSWNSNWGMGGLGRLTWGAVRERVRDLRVVTLVEAPTS